MSGDNNFLENFRVPKKKNKEKLELLSSDSDQRKFFILKLQNAFKKPDISKDSMKFHKCWSINLSEMETIYSKKRLSMRNNSSRISESIGFYFLKNESELKKLVNVGKIEVGNLLESCLGNPKMGVSLSQHSDIYHPQVPKSGIILIVKYIKSKVHYLPYDTNPMDPQPNYDCHMMRNSQAIDQSTSPFKAFHSTQVFIYEYNEDCDIENFPSQILIIGAVQFSWHGNYIYKEQNVTKPSSQPVKRVNTTINTASEPPSKKLNTGLPSQFIPQNAKVISSDMMSSTLIIGKSSKNYTQTHRLNVKLLSRLPEQSMLFNLISQNWNLVELLRSDVFEDYLCYTDENQIVRHLTLSSRAIIEFPNKFNDRKKMGATFRPKFAFHLSMMPETVKDKTMMSKLIDYLKLGDKVGSVRCNPLSNILFYIFPSGKLSRVLGLSSVDVSNSLHVVVLTEQHPQFLTCSFPAADKREQKCFLEILRNYESSTSVRNQVKPLIPLDTLKKAVTNHILKQKQYFDKVGRPAPVSADKHLDDSDMEVDSNPGEDTEATRAYEALRAAPRPMSSLVNNDISAVAPPLLSQPPPVANGLPCRPLPITSFPPPFVGHNPYPVTETVTVPPKGLLPGPVVNGFYHNPLLYMGCHPPKPFVVPSHPPPVSDLVFPVVAAPLPPTAPPVRPPAPVIDSVVPINSSVVCDSPLRVPLGSFQLVRLPYHQIDSVLNRKLGYTHRRPVHLDRGIFQTNEDHCHVSMYNG